MSQTDCARVAGVTRHAQSEWENNKTTPNAFVLMGWSKIGMDTHYIRTGQHLNNFICQKRLSFLNPSHQSNKWIQAIVSKMITIIEGKLDHTQDSLHTSHLFSSIEKITQTEHDAFGSRIKEERLRLGLNQADLTTYTQTSVRSQSFWENGQRFPNLMVLHRWHKAGFDVSYLITGRRLNHAMTTEEQRIVDVWQQADPEVRAVLSAIANLINGDQSK